MAAASDFYHDLVQHLRPMVVKIRDRKTRIDIKVGVVTWIKWSKVLPESMSIVVNTDTGEATAPIECALDVKTRVFFPFGLFSGRGPKGYTGYLSIVGGIDGQLEIYTAEFGDSLRKTTTDMFWIQYPDALWVHGGAKTYVLPPIVPVFVPHVGTLHTKYKLGKKTWYKSVEAGVSAGATFLCSVSSNGPYKFMIYKKRGKDSYRVHEIVLSENTAVNFPVVLGDTVFDVSAEPTVKETKKHKPEINFEMASVDIRADSALWTFGGFDDIAIVLHNDPKHDPSCFWATDNYFPKGQKP